MHQLEALPRPADDWIRWSTPQQWHVTLRFLGRVAAAEIPALIDELGSAVGEATAQPMAGAVVEPAEGRSGAAGSGSPGPGDCVAVAGPAVERLGTQVLCVPVAGLEPLAASVVAATAAFGEPPERRAFRGHLTVARARGRHRFGALHEGAPLAASWQVREIELIRSHTEAGGARYERLASFSLE